MSRQFFILSFFCCVLSSWVFAQKSSGIIYYSQVIDMKAGAGGQQITISGGGNFAMPEKITNKFELVFNPNGAKLQRSTVDEQLSAGEGRTFIRMGAGGRTTFFDFLQNKATEAFDLNGEELLLENKLGSMASDVQLTDETKEIIGFKCKKAVVKDKVGNETVFWYTTDLPIKASPMPGIWTEGLVLGIENDRMKYFATSIDYLKVGDKEFALPKKAKLITQDEYKKKMDEFRSKIQQGGGGTFRIGG